jgi:16S rRNA processing protein RimM
VPRADRVGRAVVLGEVIGAHGTQGELRVAVLGDGPANLLRVRSLVLLGAEDAPDPGEREVESARAGRPGEVRMRLAGVASREAAQALAGLRVAARPEQLEPLENGEHYWFQLVGCAVEAHDGRALGTVRALWETGAHDVLVVEDETGREVLLPAAADLLREVDVERGRIVIEVPEGLLDPL